MQTPPWSTKINKNTDIAEISKNLFYELESNFFGQDIYTCASKNEQGVRIAINIDKKITTNRL
jgi:hypothetical protein